MGSEAGREGDCDLCQVESEAPVQFKANNDIYNPLEIVSKPGL